MPPCKSLPILEIWGLSSPPPVTPYSRICRSCISPSVYSISSMESYLIALRFLPVFAYHWGSCKQTSQKSWEIPTAGCGARFLSSWVCAWFIPTKENVLKWCVLCLHFSSALSFSSTLQTCPSSLYLLIFVFSSPRLPSSPLPYPSLLFSHLFTPLLSSPCLFPSLPFLSRSIALGETSRHTVRTFKQLCGSYFWMQGNESSPNSCWVWPLDTGSLSPRRRQALRWWQPSCNSNQNHPDKLPLNSWPRKTMKSQMSIGWI